MQRSAIETAAKARGIELAEFCEEKASGRKLARPVLNELRAAVQRGEVSDLFVYRVDRLTRSGIRDTLAVVEELRKNGCTLHTVADGFDPSGPGAELVLAVLAWAAEMERSVISERIKSARERVERQGGRWGRPRKIDPGTLSRMRTAKKEGKTIRQVSKAFKVPRATVQRALAQKGHYSPQRLDLRNLARENNRPKRALTSQGSKMDEATCPVCSEKPAEFAYTWPGQPEGKCCDTCRNSLTTHASSLGLELRFAPLALVEAMPPTPRDGSHENDREKVG